MSREELNFDWHVTSSTSIPLEQFNYENDGKLNIKTILKENKNYNVFGKSFALLLKAIIVFEILVNSR